MSAAWIVVIILAVAVAFLIIAAGIMCIMEVAGKESRTEEKHDSMGQMQSDRPGK